MKKYLLLSILFLAFSAYGIEKKTPSGGTVKDKPGQGQTLLFNEGVINTTWGGSTGWNSLPNINIRWTKLGRLVTLYFPPILATSTDTSRYRIYPTIALPSTLWPSQNTYAVVAINRGNSPGAANPSVTPGALAVTTAGAMYLYVNLTMEGGSEYWGSSANNGTIYATSISYNTN